MPTPISGLTPLVLVTPVLPLGATGISVDSTVLPYSVLTDVKTIRLEVLIYNQTLANSTPVLVNNGTQNQFTGSVTLDPSIGNTNIQLVGRNYDPNNTTWHAATQYVLNYRLVDSNGFVQVVTTAGISGGTIPAFSSTLGQTTVDGAVVWKNLGFIEITPTIKFQLLFFVSQNSLVIAPPAGVRSYKAQSVCRLEWQQPLYLGSIGTRVMLSTDEAGINPPFVQFGDLVPTAQITRSSEVIVASNTSVTIDSITGNRITTTVDGLQTVNYNSIDISQANVNGANEFFAMVSTVVQDPTTNIVYESQQNGPITCGFVNLKVVNPTDFLALQRKEDIAGRLIQQMTRYYPDLDLTPRSELRDLVVDPVAIELSNMSVREWFSRVSTSISAITQVDDANSDGFSDPFTQSPAKQQISRAYGLNANDTQTLIDKQFDILGEQAGLTRGGSTSSVVTLTFYTFVRPTQTATFAVGIICATVPDAQTPALTFITTGSATIDPSSANAFYDPINGWWAVSVPAVCQTTGSITDAGAGTIRSVTSGAPSGWNVTNLVAADFGQDEELNSKFAARIAARLVTGVDSGTRHGYLTAALSTPGIVAATVVAAGDTEMLRDWDSIRQKHVFGCVDIYTKGVSFSEQDEAVAFQYTNTGQFGSPTSYASLTLLDKTLLKFQIKDFSSQPYPFYSGVQLFVSRASGNFYLGLDRAQFDNDNGFIILNPLDMAYQIVGDSLTQAKVPFVLNGNPATNKTVITYLSTQSGTTTFQLFARFQSPLLLVPGFQPVIKINSVTGETGQTGTLDPSLISLIHTSDFLLSGGSNQAGDTVKVSTQASSTITKTITASLTNPAVIDSAMDILIDTNGVPGNILSIRSEDFSTLYGFGTDYTIVPTAAYRSYGVVPLTVNNPITNIAITNNVITAICANKFGVNAPITLSGLSIATFLNGQAVVVASASDTQFTAVYTHADFPATNENGIATGSSIQDGQSIVVSYNKFFLNEKLSFVSNELHQLDGTTPAILSDTGFVFNTWLPESYNNTTLSLDGAAFNPDGTIDLVLSTGLVGALIPHDSRYIKVTFNGTVMKENADFALAVDPVSGAAAISRNVTNISNSRIPDGGIVQVSYFVTETFSVATEFPAFVEILANNIAKTKHAAADVLVKAMIANPVDITLTVALEPNAAADTLDPVIRTIIDRVLDNASGVLYQSELIRQVKAINGVQNVQLPLIKCAKSDGAYDIGIVIPTATGWIPLSQDPAFLGILTPQSSFISTLPVLPDTTIPSGGTVDGFVGFLFQGESYRRAFTIEDFLTNSSASVPSFYIIGVKDQISPAKLLDFSYAQRVIVTIPSNIASPSLRSYLVTYQVFGEGTAKDIVMSSTEYLTPGRITINYVAGN